MKRNVFKVIGGFALTAALAVGCTDLEISETDSIFEEGGTGEFTGVEDPASAVTNLFNDLNALGDQANFFALQEVSTDEQLVPTRGTDWGDNGIWRTLHAHTWDAAHQYVLNTWNNWNQGIFRASEIIDPRSDATAEQVAQAKFVRAIRVWGVLDLYGQVPFREVDEGPDVNPRVLTRQEAVDLILSDLDDAIADLPTVSAGSVDLQNRGSKAAARFMKAKVLLNKHIYLQQAQPEGADMNEVISLVDAIEGDGYALEDDYFGIFAPEADNETIFWLQTAVGNRIWNGMHYNIVSPDNAGGGWNGFSTLAEFYDLFEGDPNSNFVGDGQEERRGFVPDASNAGPNNFGIGYGFLIGQQYAEDGTPLTTRPGAPLTFTRDFPGLVGNTEETGIRVIKYHPVDGGSFRNHEIFFRFADAYLMRSEARWYLGTDITAEINTLRATREASPLGSVGAGELLAERGRELYVEFWRRNDLIRFGQFTADWEFKDPGAVGDANLNVYPIPSQALLGNPNLTQNPGY